MNMVKPTVVLAISIVISALLINGCSGPVHQDSEPLQPASVETDTAVPVRQPVAEPIRLEPDMNQPAVHKPPKPAPNDINLPQTELPAEKPVIKTKPDDSNTAAIIVNFHEKTAPILSEFVNYEGMVRYKKLRRQRLALKNLLEQFEKLDRNEYDSWSEQDRIAFWINAYNVHLLNIIVENYPIEASRILSVIWGPYSIRHIKGIWRDYKFLIMDEEFTLSEIENRFFRKEFDEPRAFLALCRASFSGPPLRNKPYCGAELESQLNQQAKRFLSSPKAFRIDREKHKVYISPLLKSSWFGNAFVNKYATDKKFKDKAPAVRAVLNFITNYISPSDVSFLETANYTVEYINYDWTLNDIELNE